MGVLADLGAAVAAAKKISTSLDVDCLEGRAAASLVALSAEGERVFAAIKTRAARRATDCNIHRETGTRSDAHWLAGQTGTTVGDAQAMLAAADAMRALPDTDAAFRAGELSMAQATEVAAGASAAPEREAELLQVAKTDDLRGLRNKAKEVIAQACPDLMERHRAIHAGRYLRTWTDRDGSGRLAYRSTADELALILNALGPFEREAFERARREGRHESHEAYAADALLGMAEAAAHGTATPGRRGRHHAVNVLVSHDALIRGNTMPGETCEIAGVGSVPVQRVKEIIEGEDPYLAAVVTDGVDVFAVAHMARKVTSHQRTALMVRDRECEVPDCHVTQGLEIDHTASANGWADTRRTQLSELARICSFNHDQKTREGYQLVGPKGDRLWLDPKGNVIASDRVPFDAPLRNADGENGEWARDGP